MKFGEKSIDFFQFLTCLFSDFLSLKNCDRNKNTNEKNRLSLTEEGEKVETKLLNSAI